MIKAEIVSNGQIRLILEGDDPVSKEALRQLDGATCKLFTEPIRIVDKNITEGLIIAVSNQS